MIEYVRERKLIGTTLGTKEKTLNSSRMSEEAEDMLKDTRKSFNFSHHGMSQFGSRAHSKEVWS